MHDFDGVGEQVQRWLVETNTASVACAVAQGGQIIWEAGFGWADRERRVPATAHTLYAIASVSKPLTATGIMTLVEQGQIKLDTPIEHYLGDARLRSWVGEPSEVTVRHILSHSAGLLPLVQYYFADEDAVPPPRPETIRRYGHIVTPPGERYWYSNLGYGMLDHVLSRVSGVSYGDFMRQTIFWPLGMNRTTLEVGPALRPYQAACYTRQGVRLPPFTFSHPGGSAVWSTAYDLARFGMFHAGAHLADQRPILNAQSVALMQQPVVSINGTSDCGLCWALISDEGGYTAIGHDGYMSGASARLRILPEQGVVVAVVTNGQRDLYKRTVSALLAEVLPDYHRAEQSDQEPIGEPFRVAPTWLGHWQGAVHTHQGERSLWIDFRTDGEVHARLGDQWVMLVNEPAFDGHGFTGVMPGDLGMDDATDLDRLQWHLWLRGDQLVGAVQASTNPGPDGRRRSQVACPVTLRKA